MCLNQGLTHYTRLHAGAVNQQQTETMFQQMQFYLPRASSAIQQSAITRNSVI